MVLLVEHWAGHTAAQPRVCLLFQDTPGEGWRAPVVGLTRGQHGTYLEWLGFPGPDHRVTNTQPVLSKTQVHT